MREGVIVAPEASRVLKNQGRLMKATLKVLESIADDFRQGFLETVGIHSTFLIDDDRCAVALELPAAADTELIARSIDAENVEAWQSQDGKVCIAIDPWYSTKDVDQAVLSAIKVIHVLLGMHAIDSEQPRSLRQKLLKSVAEIMQLQNRNGK